MQNNSDRARLENFIKIGQRLNRHEDLGEILQEISNAAADLTQSRGSSILLFEEDTQQLYFAAARADNRESLMQIRVPIEKSVAGWVFKQGSPLNVPNAKIDSLIGQNTEIRGDVIFNGGLHVDGQEEAVPAGWADQVLDLR